MGQIRSFVCFFFNEPKLRMVFILLKDCKEGYATEIEYGHKACVSTTWPFRENTCRPLAGVVSLFGRRVLSDIPSSSDVPKL